MAPSDIAVAQSRHPARLTHSRRNALLLLAFAFAIVWFSNLDYRNLVRPDEGRYAEIAREMLASSDWITPRLNGIKYFEKPPLQYWMTAAAYWSFGESEWTARLWTALSGFAGIVITGLAGARLFGRAAGFNAAVVLAGSFLYIGIGHMNTLDMGVTFWLSSALFGFLLAQDTQSPPALSRRWMLASWAAIGLGFLSKGLISLLLPGIALTIYIAIERDFALLRRLHAGYGLVVFLVIALPWVIAVSIANPEFPAFFFIHEHFARFLTQEHHREGAWWYFIPVLVAGFLPWTTMLGHAALRAWRMDSTARQFKVRRFLLIYVCTVFVFFSVSGSKLASYILPLFPAFALLLGEWLTQIDGRRLSRFILPVAGLAGVGVALTPFTARFGSLKIPADLYAHFGHWLTAAFLVFLFACGASFFLARSGRLRSAIVTMGCGSLLMIQIVLTGHQTLSPSYSAAQVAEIVKPYLGADVPFYSIRTYEHTLPFYIKRTVTLVDYRDEFDFGLRQQPELQIATLQEFLARWKNDRKALAIMGPDVYQSLAQQGLPMRVLSSDARWVVVSRS
jgi:4-amino-4-deoxy-L-arabinose transferase-like glycosyltransferase